MIGLVGGVLAAMSPPLLAAGIVAVALLLAWALAAALRRRDHFTYVLSRAPQLPVRALAAHDDAWLRGTVVCEAPLVCPWFDVECVAYDYRVEIEVKKTRTKRDANGKVRTVVDYVWEVESQDAKQLDFDLDDGETIRVLLTEGTNEATRSLGADYEHSKRRHLASVLAVGDEVSVLGVKRDDGGFGSLAEVPLLVTYQTRAQRVASSRSSEAVLFFFACLLPFVGVAVAAAVLQEADTLQQWLLALPWGFAAWVPQWWLLTYNRLVRLRQQVRAAERQIDVELSFRAALVPNLAAVVQAYAAHERELLADLAAIRAHGSLGERVGAEADAVAAMRSMLVLHERHPQLRADPLYRDLHDRLWAIEEKLAHARGAYSDTVTEWNDRLGAFPSLLVAKAMRAKPSPLFAAECEAALPPRLALD
ncbi:MAG: hypothetical protein RL398_3219 [Planctomycetota bacterium]